MSNRTEAVLIYLNEAFSAAKKSIKSIGEIYNSELIEKILLEM